MRLDKFLKVSRIIKRRTVAKEACDKGIVKINGKVVFIHIFLFVQRFRLALTAEGILN